MIYRTLLKILENQTAFYTRSCLTHTGSYKDHQITAPTISLTSILSTTIHPNLFHTHIILLFCTWMFVMVPNLWKCSFNLAMLFRSRGIFFNSSVSLNFFGKPTRLLTGTVWLTEPGTCIGPCWGGAGGCCWGRGCSWGSTGVVVFGSECMTILSGIVGTVGRGAAIPGT